MKKLSAPQRKQQLLQTVAKILENTRNSTITTAHIATMAGVSEATLYRHFKSKDHLFEALIEFSEVNVFSLLNKINQDQYRSVKHIKQMVHTLLIFADKNPGISRLMINGALATNSVSLQSRSVQFFKRCESQFKQSLQMAKNNEQLPQKLDHAVTANLIQSIILGKWQQYVLSDFQTSPLLYWQEQWLQIEALLKQDFD